MFSSGVPWPGKKKASDKWLEKIQMEKVTSEIDNRSLEEKMAEYMMDDGDTVVRGEE